MMKEGSNPCERLPWDSDFFGFPIARVRDSRLTREGVERIDAWCRAAGVRCLYFLARADDPTTSRLAERHGFDLVDVRVTLELRPGRPEGSAGSGELRAAQVRDLPALQEIAAQGYTDSRFYFDRRFPRRLASALYETWIENSVKGYAQAVLVSTDGADRPLGYISCHLSEGGAAGQIGLVGVGAGARGRGLGMRLVGGAVDWFLAAGATRISVVTQGRNTAAQRLYQRCGFLTRDLRLWYHKWYPPAKETGS